MGQYGFGQAVPREEDPRLLRGEGFFIHDVVVTNQAYGYVLRSPHAHARIVKLDASKAKDAPGVLGVFTAEDIKHDGLGTTRCRIPRQKADGSPMYQNPHPGLVGDRVRFVGDQIAYVVAETLEQAKDAAELIEVEYSPLPAVGRLEAAIEKGAPAVWEECPDNRSFLFQQGDKAKVDTAFAKAAKIVKHRFVISRIAANAIEPRGAVGEYDRRFDRYTLHSCIGTPHGTRRLIAEEVLKVPENKFRVVVGDVGGAFGSKGVTSTENILALYAAKKVGRPVKWVAERQEAFLSDDHARDNVSDVELALDSDGKFLALRVTNYCNLGAYLTSDRTILSTFGNLGTLAGVYTTPAIHVSVWGVFTNTVATATYRGAGRPEACYLIEGIIDRAARETGIDRVELRRRNLIPPSAMPFKTGLIYVYDCGEFEKGLDQALHMADWNGFEKRRAEAKSRGKLRGIGLAIPIERAGAPPGPETTQIRFDPTGTVTLVAGTVSQGQGHETMYKILLSHTLGIDSNDVMLITGDTDKVAFGSGTFGSRSAVIAGSAVVAAAEKIIDKGRKIAAHILEAAETDIEFAKGVFTVAGTDRRLPLKEVAKIAYQTPRLPRGMEAGLVETGVFEPESQTFPNGTHICEVEIDRDTGRLEIVRYVVVDDVGHAINALTLEGQVHGGVVQGVGQAFLEHMNYDRDSGQLTSGSFMDYAMPRADDICSIDMEENPVPTKLNPLGVKGAGEAGTVGGLPVVISAAIDALQPLGVADLEMPLTSEKLWRAIHGN